MLPLVLGAQLPRGDAEDECARDPANQPVQCHPAPQVLECAGPDAVPLHGRAAERELDELDVSAVDSERLGQHGQLERSGPPDGRVPAGSGSVQTCHRWHVDGLQRRAADHSLDALRAVDILSAQGQRGGRDCQAGEVPGARVRSLDAFAHLSAVAAERVFGGVVQ